MDTRMKLFLANPGKGSRLDS